jgi:hypothetical protein
MTGASTVDPDKTYRIKEIQLRSIVLNDKVHIETFDAVSPEGLVSAPPSTWAVSEQTGTLWIKAAGDGPTGWQEVQTSSPTGLPFVDITDFGASSSSADNSVAIQNAIDYTDAVDSLLIVPAGSYSYSTPLTNPNCVPIVCVGQLVFTGSGDHALTFGGQATNVDSASAVPSVIKLLRVVQDWTDAFAGLAIINVDNFQATVNIQDFECGVLLRGSNVGCAYNKISPQTIFGCRVGVRFHALGTGWSNENIIFGGRFGTLQATNTALNIHGFEFVCDSAVSRPNGNKILGSSVELHNTGAGYTSAVHGTLSVGTISANFNSWLELRIESTDYFLSGAGLINNTISVTFANIFNEATALDILRGNTPADDLILIQNVFDTNVITFGSSDPIRVSGYNRNNVVAVGANLWRPARGVTWNRAGTSVANTVTGSLNADTLTIANADGMAVVLDLRNVNRDYQRFLTLKAEARATGGRLFCVCWDAAFNRLTGADDCSLGFNAGVGYYRTGSDMTVDSAEANVSFGANVAFVLCGVASGTASAQITQFDVFALGAADIRPVYGVDLLNSLSTTPPGIGTYDSGEPVSNTIPSAPSTDTFYPAGLFCRNVLGVTSAAEGWVYDGAGAWAGSPTMANPNFGSIQINTPSSLFMGDGSTNGDVLIMVRKADANNQNFLEHRLGTASSGARWRRQWSSSEAINVNRLDTSGINPVTFYQDDYVNIIRRMRRVIIDQGTTVTASAFGSSGLGSGATIVMSGTWTAKDQGCQITVTIGTGPGANPTITFTFVDGAFPNAPFASVVRNGGTGTLAHTWVTSATTLTITLTGTPTVGDTFILNIRI